jgi:small subunit ribosomal protein S16
MRMGKKKQPTYRVVAAESRKARNGRFIEIIGTYEPRREPSVIEIDNDKAVHWLREGAQPTERVEKLLKISGAWDVFTGAAPAATSTAATAEPAGASAEAAEPAEAESAASS